MIIRWLLEKRILGNFFKIEFSATEEKTAYNALETRYIPGVRYGLLISILILPATLVFDTEVLVAILIPITIVAGSAWFAITLANIKDKFLNLGIEVTRSMFKSFMASLGILGVVIISSLLKTLTKGSAFWEFSALFEWLAAGLGMLAVLSILWHLFVGALKYDMNDAMLTGRQEVAELFFRQSLSSLHRTASELRDGKDLETANYYIAVSLLEMMHYAKEMNVKPTTELKANIDKAYAFKLNPLVEQSVADATAYELLNTFLSWCDKNETVIDTIHGIEEEITVLKKSAEPQRLVDTRLANVFESIGNLIQQQGESLFKK